MPGRLTDRLCVAVRPRRSPARPCAIQIGRQHATRRIGTTATGTHLVLEDWLGAVSPRATPPVTIPARKPVRLRFAESLLDAF